MSRIQRHTHETDLDWSHLPTLPVHASPDTDLAANSWILTSRKGCMTTLVSFNQDQCPNAYSWEHGRECYGIRDNLLQGALITWPWKNIKFFLNKPSKTTNTKNNSKPTRNKANTNNPNKTTNKQNKNKKKPKQQKNTQKENSPKTEHLGFAAVNASAGKTNSTFLELFFHVLCSPALSRVFCLVWGHRAS